MLRGKRVLVAGGAGLIGRQLISLLQKDGSHVTSVDLRKSDNPLITEKQLDLTVYENCVAACSGMDWVFNLLCAKGSPQAMAERPASHFVPMMLFNTNLMRAAKECMVDKFLFASTLGVYGPADRFVEDDVWMTFPSRNDRFAGWAKRMGELQAEAYQIQYGWDDISIVRPANTYGPYDDFHSDGSMVIPSLVRKVLSSDGKLVVHGDGSNIRDFIHCRDVARGMMVVMEASPGPCRPINLGSGVGYSIRELVEIIVNVAGTDTEVVWDTRQGTGDRIRVLDTRRAESLGFSPRIGLEQGIRELIEWYSVNDERESH